MNARALLLVCLFGLACKAAEPEITPAMLRAQSPYDLGEDGVDVTVYPEAQQRAYFSLRDRCSLCHPLARAVNFPARTEAEWGPYVTQMNMHSGKILLEARQERQILDFLVFDSQRRKSSPAFTKELERLRALWARVQKEKAARGEGKP